MFPFTVIVKFILVLFPFAGKVCYAVYTCVFSPHELQCTAMSLPGGFCLGVFDAYFANLCIGNFVFDALEQGYMVIIAIIFVNHCINVCLFWM